MPHHKLNEPAGKTSPVLLAADGQRGFYKVHRERGKWGNQQSGTGDITIYVFL